MNDKQVITKLKLLQQVRPSTSVLRAIKEDVDQNLDANIRKDSPRTRIFLQSYLFLKQSSSMTRGLTFIFFIGLIFMLSFLVSPQMMQNVIRDSKMTVASNHYEKASIALTDTIKRYGDNKEITKDNLEDFSSALAVTNTQMSGLRLKGESGKYSSKQCQDLYREYLSFLRKKYASTSSSFPELRSQIGSYEEQAETKLTLYHHL